MKKIFLSAATIINIFAFSIDLKTFQADFTQSVKDEKGNILTYEGSLKASKPQNVKWQYLVPIIKDVYINNDRVTIIEPEIEQVIIKKIDTNLDFFNIIKNATKTNEHTYVANYKNTKFTITMQNNVIDSIVYIDEFENNVSIEFAKQITDKEIDKKEFFPIIPQDFDIIKD